MLHYNGFVTCQKSCALIPSVPKNNSTAHAKNSSPHQEIIPTRDFIAGSPTLCLSISFSPCPPGPPFASSLLLVLPLRHATGKSQCAVADLRTYLNSSSPSFTSVSKVVGPQPASHMLATIYAFEVVPTRPSPRRPASRDSLKLEGWDHYTRPAMMDRHPPVLITPGQVSGPGIFTRLDAASEPSSEDG